MARKSRTSASAVPPRGGNTFRVHRALNEASALLPDVLFSRPSLLPSGISLSSGSLSGAIKSKAVQPALRAVQTATGFDSGAVNVRSDKTCKLKPASSSGNGKGRPFVPWCKK